MVVKLLQLRLLVSPLVLLSCGSTIRPIFGDAECPSTQGKISKKVIYKAFAIPVNRARQLYKNISMLFLFPVKR